MKETINLYFFSIGGGGSRHEPLRQNIILLYIVDMSFDPLVGPEGYEYIYIVWPIRGRVGFVILSKLSIRESVLVSACFCLFLVQEIHRYQLKPPSFYSYNTCKPALKVYGPNKDHRKPAQIGNRTQLKVVAVISNSINILNRCK